MVDIIKNQYHCTDEKLINKILIKILNNLICCRFDIWTSRNKQLFNEHKELINRQKVAEISSEKKLKKKKYNDLTIIEIIKDK